MTNELVDANVMISEHNDVMSRRNQVADNKQTKDKLLAEAKKEYEAKYGKIEKKTRTVKGEDSSEDEKDKIN